MNNEFTNYEMMKSYQISVTILFLFCTLLPGFAQQTKTLTLLQTSDTHSRIEPIDDHAADKYAGMGGFVRRATMLEQFRKNNPDVLLFDCGDFSQGTPYYNLFKGEVEVEMLNLMKYDAATIGNHEFDFGLENMARLFKMADFPIVCANYGVEGTVLEGLVKPYIILERDGLKIGVFGLGAKMEGLVQAEKCEGVTFKDPVLVADEIAAKLKDVEGCDAVVCLSHLGVKEDEMLVHQTRNIDVVLGGHSHTFMQEPVIYPNIDGEDVPVSHTGKNGIFVGKVDLTFQR
ncbi:bifunctional metallophosphatase/5'-nucleotidase [Bacteroides sp.]